MYASRGGSGRAGAGSTTARATIGWLFCERHARASRGRDWGGKRARRGWPGAPWRGLRDELAAERIRLDPYVLQLPEGHGPARWRLLPGSARSAVLAVTRWCGPDGPRVASGRNPRRTGAPDGPDQRGDDEVSCAWWRGRPLVSVPPPTGRRAAAANGSPPRRVRGLALQARVLWYVTPRQVLAPPRSRPGRRACVAIRATASTTSTIVTGLVTHRPGLLAQLRPQHLSRTSLGEGRVGPPATWSWRSLPPPPRPGAGFVRAPPRRTRRAPDGRLTRGHARPPRRTRGVQGVLRE